MARGIDITIGLRDNLTASLRSAVGSAGNQVDSLQRRLDGLRGPSNLGSAVGGSGGSASGSMFGDMLKADLIGNAVSSLASSIISAGQSLISAIGSQFNAAEEANRGALGATSANAALLGIGFKESAGLTKQISATLAKSAEKLPGATKDYLDAFNGVSDTLSLSGGMTKKGLTAEGTSMVELVAMLGKASGAGSGSTSTAIGKMLGDTGSEALFRIDAFEKVPAFKALLEKDLEKAGKTLKDFFKMDSAAKQTLLVGVKNTLFSKDYVGAMNLTMGAQIDTLKARLFDPTSGLFGFMRYVEVGGKETNVLEQLGKTFSDLSKKAQSILGGLSGGLDPMVELIKGLQHVSKMVADPSLLLDAAMGFLSGIGHGLTGLQIKLVQWLGSTLSGLASGGVDVQLVVAKVTSGLVGIIDSLFKSFASQGSETQGGMLMVLVGGLALVGNVALGIIYGLADSLPGLLVTVLSGIGSALSQVPAAFGNLFSALSGMVMDMSSPVRDSVGNFFGSIGSGIGSLVESIPSKLEAIGNAVSSIGSAISSAIQAKVQEGLATISNAMNVVGNAIQGKPIGAKYSGQNMDRLQSYTGNQRFNDVGIAAEGNLLSAARLESSKMPSGSSLVVANSSELIVPRNQINAVLGGSGATVNVTVNTQADRVIQDTVLALTQALNKPSLSMV